MRLIEFKTFLFHSHIEDHKNIKDNLLQFFKKKKESFVDKDKGQNDNIDNLDWKNSHDNSREWVRLFFPILQKKLNQMIKASGLTKCTIYDVWFQQYEKEGTHGWHTHGSNYTGVYYVDLNDDNPRTEILLPTDPSKKYTVDVNEGDIIIFPSYFIHRAPVNKSNNSKTIISFNFDAINPMRKYVEN
jgi:hypothetical protein